MRPYLFLSIAAMGLSADMTRCIVDSDDLQKCQGETPIADATTMLQVTSFKANDVSITDPAACSLAADAVWAAMDSYKKGVPQPVVAQLQWTAAAANNLHSAFWKSASLWPAKSDDTNNVDNARLWVKDGSCLMAFRGSDKKCSYKAGRPTFIELGNGDFHGLNVHLGVKAELDALLNKMQPNGGLAMLKQTCTNGLTFTGHSMGGGTAQLLATLLNKKGDPLAAGLTVDRIYGFGPTAFLKGKPAINDKSSDGCFAGGMYVNALGKDRHGSPRVDLVWQELASKYRHVKTAHHILLSPGDEIVTPCGKEAPYPATGRTVRATGWDAHDEALYINNVGCSAEQ